MFITGRGQRTGQKNWNFVMTNAPLSPPDEPAHTETLVQELAAALLARGWSCSTAESCTGGLIGAVLTALPGSSCWYKGGVISYSNEIKTSLLGVSPEMLARYGAVSELVARRMALGVCERLFTHAAMSVTGVAGPDGGSAEKPVGTVWLGWAVAEASGLTAWTESHHFPGGRAEVRQAAVRAALRGLLRRLR